MRLTDFDVLTFDMIGTLIDFERGLLDFMRPRLLRAQHEAGDTDILETYARVQGEIRARAPQLNFSGRLPKIWEGVAAHYGVAVEAGDAPAIVRSARQWPAFADSAAALAELKRYFRFLVVVTNGDRVSARVMANTLCSPFSEIITEEDMGAAKPDPRAFQYFIEHLERLGVKKERILHVAQSQYHDIGTAHEVGLATAWIYRRHGQPGYGGTQAPPRFTAPDFLAVSLADLVRQFQLDLGA